MIARTLTAMALLVLSSLTSGQETPRTIVDTYEALADAILSIKKSEHEFVQSLLDYHRQTAAMHVEAGEYGEAAAHIALFANEGDNAIAGVRKRLLDGGHHHNAEGEAQGIYEPGYVIVTRAAKKSMLEASAAMRTAGNKSAAGRAWSNFNEQATRLIASD